MLTAFVGQAILTEACLSFLGIGMLQKPRPAGASCCRVVQNMRETHLGCRSSRVSRSRWPYYDFIYLGMRCAIPWIHVCDRNNQTVFRRPGDIANQSTFWNRTSTPRWRSRSASTLRCFVSLISKYAFKLASLHCVSRNISPIDRIGRLKALNRPPKRPADR